MTCASKAPGLQHSLSPQHWRLAQASAAIYILPLQAAMCQPLAAITRQAAKLLADGDPEAAIAKLEQLLLLQDRPDHVESFVNKDASNSSTACGGGSNGDSGSGIGANHLTAAAKTSATALLQAARDAQALLASARAARQRNQWQPCLDACDALLSRCNAAECPGLAAAARRERSAGLIACGRSVEALDDASTALQLQPMHAEGLHLRSRAYKALGRYHEAFADLQTLSRLQPQRPSIPAELRAVARLCTGGSSSRGNSATSSSAGPNSNSGRGSGDLASCFEVLGLPRGATPPAVRAAYLRLAAQFHPDKNPQGADHFVRLQQAYERLKAAGAA